MYAHIITDVTQTKAVKACRSQSRAYILWGGVHFNLSCK